MAKSISLFFQVNINTKNNYFLSRAEMDNSQSANQLYCKEVNLEREVDTKRVGKEEGFVRVAMSNHITRFLETLIDVQPYSLHPGPWGLLGISQWPYPGPSQRMPCC